MYVRGKGLPQSDEGAVKWWRLAAEPRPASDMEPTRGNPDAQCHLRVMYRDGGTGEVCPRDISRQPSGLGWRPSKGHAAAQNNLGAMCQPKKNTKNNTARGWPRTTRSLQVVATGGQTRGCT